MVQKVTGTCMITRLRMGDNIYITINVDGSPCIIYDDKTIYTDFSKNPLTLTGYVESAQDAAITIKSASWQVGGTTVTAGTSYEVTNTTLKIKGPIITDVSKIGNVLVTWKVVVVSQGVEQTLQKTIEITAVNGGANSYWGTVQAGSSTILTASYTNVVLGHQLNLGGTKVTYGSGYTVQWLLNGSAVAASKVDSKGNLTVTRDDVNGMAYAICNFYVNGSLVESDGVSIVDVADEVQIVINDHYDVKYGGTVSITPKLIRVTSAGSTTAITSGITWSVEVRNNYTMAVISSADYTFSASTGAFSMTEAKMYDSSKKEYSPVVIFSATV